VSRIRREGDDPKGIALRDLAVRKGPRPGRSVRLIESRLAVGVRDSRTHVSPPHFAWGEGCAVPQDTAVAHGGWLTWPDPTAAVKEGDER